MTTLFEHAMLEKRNMPGDTWRSRWLPYIQQSYERSVELRRFYESNRHFYVRRYRRLIEKRIAPKLSFHWRLVPVLRKGPELHADQA